jgi:hypothetical protein
VWLCCYDIIFCVLYVRLDLSLYSGLKVRFEYESKHYSQILFVSWSSRVLDDKFYILQTMDHLYSKKKSKRCCVLHCEDNISKRHRFPKDKELFHKWISNINNPALYNLTIEQVYKSYYVCDRHFSADCLVPGTLRGLTKTAVPTLCLGLGI